MAAVNIRNGNRLKKLIGTIWYIFARSLCTGIVCSLYRVRMYGKKNVPLKGPALLLCNHQSFFDPIFSQAWIIHPFHFVARDSLYDIRVFGLMIRGLKTIPIKRGQADITAMKSIIEKLKHKRSVCLYPEGTRTSDGRIAEVKPGFGLISRKTNAPVIPVVIDGAYEAWPRERKFPKLLGKVYVSYGKPIPPERIKELGDRQFAKELTDILRKMQNSLRTKIGKEPFQYSCPEIPAQQKGAEK